MDYTEIVLALIGVVVALLSVGMTYAWKKWIKPWLLIHGLYEEAEIVVGAVEAILGRHLGEDKWRLAIKKMQERGFNVDDVRVLDALRAAWKKLDLTQLLSGEKEPPAKDADGE